MTEMLFNVVNPVVAEIVDKGFREFPYSCSGKDITTDPENVQNVLHMPQVYLEYDGAFGGLTFQDGEWQGFESGVKLSEVPTNEEKSPFNALLVLETFHVFLHTIYRKYEDDISSLFEIVGKEYTQPCIHLSNDLPIDYASMTYEDGSIRVNTDLDSFRDVDSVFKTAAHELAHHIQNQLFPNTDAHGFEFSLLARLFGDTESDDDDEYTDTSDIPTHKILHTLKELLTHDS